MLLANGLLGLLLDAKRLLVLLSVGAFVLWLARRSATRSRPAATASKSAPSGPAPDRFRFACPCGEGIWARLEHAGKQARCPACAEVVTIPPPPV